jgi:putative FmdB family regulatory protein
VPTYDYQCRSCGSITEVIHSMLEDGPTECERCGGELRRVFHPTGIIFKGGGFYKTDSRSSSSSGAGGGTTGGSSGSSDGSATASSSDTKTGGTIAAPKASEGSTPKREGGSD